jgi:hypothetical protein
MEIRQLRISKRNDRKEKAVATELVHANNGHSSDRDTLFMLSGLALMVFGAGLILSNPSAQRLLSRVGVGNLGERVLPDIERYLRLRSM